MYPVYFFHARVSCSEWNVCFEDDDDVRYGP